MMWRRSRAVEKVTLGVLTVGLALLQLTFRLVFDLLVFDVAVDINLLDNFCPEKSSYVNLLINILI